MPFGPLSLLFVLMLWSASLFAPHPSRIPRTGAEVENLCRLTARSGRSPPLKPRPNRPRLPDCYTIKDSKSSYAGDAPLKYKSPTYQHMKSVLLSFAACLSLYAQTFTTGQAARVVVGQPIFTSEDNRSSDTILGAVGGIALANGTLLVTDSNRVGATPINNRVMVYNNIINRMPGINDAFNQDSVRCNACIGRADLVLGQTSFTGFDPALTQTGLRLPTAVSYDGRRVAVADTDNNRVLIWNSLPTSSGQPADLVLGQPDFKTARAGTTQATMRGPQGVWLFGDRVFVADTQNSRVLIWNTFPTSNGKAPDLVIGQKDFVTGFQPNTSVPTPTASTTLNPISATTDGVRLFVSDLGHNRVLIWNSIPTANGQPADIVLGQPDFTSFVSNNSSKLCDSDGKDSSGNLTYPARCGRTMEFPRFAFADAKRFYVADSGNDRVLVWNSVPTRSQQPPDIYLGQPDEFSNFVSDFSNANRSSATDALRTPLALASDNQNLFVTDTQNRRVVVFTVGNDNLPLTAVVNSAAQEIRAIGGIQFTGSIQKDDVISIKISDSTVDGSESEYKYTVLDTDKLSTLPTRVANVINSANNGAGDPYLLANPNEAFNTVVLIAKKPGKDGDNATFVVSATNTSPKISFTPTTLFGGGDAATLAPGTIVSITGTRLALAAESAPNDGRDLPRELGGAQVYIDGVQIPLLYASPTQINAQVPVELSDTTSASLIVRTRQADGSWISSRAIPINVISQNPGIFAFPGDSPRRGIAFHTYSKAHATVFVEGTTKNGDISKITVGDGDAARTYTYTTTSDKTINNRQVRDGLIALINADPDSPVTAEPGGSFNRVILLAKADGTDGENIKIATSFTVSTTTSDPGVQIGAFNDRTCCSNVAGSLVNEDNPAVPGEAITVLATGLGLVDADNQRFQATGTPYQGPRLNDPIQFVNGQVNGATAQILAAGLKPGTLGIYEVVLELANGATTNPQALLWIGQSFQVSNQVTIAVKNPADNQ